jgi:hypothetical protein
MPILDTCQIGEFLSQNLPIWQVFGGFAKKSIMN